MSWQRICNLLLLLLLAAPTWLCGHCGRHNSPPASSVMDLVFRRSDCSHVSVDTVHPSLLRSSSLSSPVWYHLQRLSSDVVLVSPLYVAKPPESRFPAPLSDSVWPQAHLHIFISVTSSFFTWVLVTGTVSIPYSIAGGTIILWIFPFTCGGTLLTHRTPDIFLQLFRPHCVDEYAIGSFESWHPKRLGDDSVAFRTKLKNKNVPAHIVLVT